MNRNISFPIKPLVIFTAYLHHQIKASLTEPKSHPHIFEFHPFGFRKTEMGVTCYAQELKTPVAPARMFKALFLDSHSLIPKIAPQGIKSIVFVEGDGGVGSIKQTNFADGRYFD